jgi:hypothetical protein
VQAQKGKAPTPDNALTINNSSGSLHALQGTIGESVRQTIGLESGWRDPQSGKPYTHYLYSDKKHFQLLGMFEQEWFQDRFAWESPFVNTVYAESADLTPVTIGTKLWVVLDTETETPINEVLTGSTTLASLAASGATVVGSSVGTGSSVVITNSNISALSNPFGNGGAVANSTPTVPLEEQLYGAGSAYVAMWGSTTCVPANITVVEVNEVNFLTTFPGSRTWGGGWVWVAANTIYNFAPGDYRIDITSGVGLSECSAIVGAWKGVTTIGFQNFTGMSMGGWNFYTVSGGAYWNPAATYAISKNVTFAFNSPYRNGGAAYMVGHYNVLDGVEFVLNGPGGATVHGSAKFMNNTTMDGTVIDN